MTDPTSSSEDGVVFGTLEVIGHGEPDAATRVLRTVLQVLVAVAGAVPAAVALLPVSATNVAWIVGIAGALVVLVTAVQNVIESRPGVRPLLSRGPSDDAGQSTPLINALIIVILIVVLILLLRGTL